MCFVCLFVCNIGRVGVGMCLVCNIARFGLRAHTLRGETGCWQIHNMLFDKCDLHDVQDKKHVIFYALV